MKEHSIRDEQDILEDSPAVNNKGTSIPQTVNLKIVFEEWPHSAGSGTQKELIELIEQFPLHKHIDSFNSHLNLKSILQELSTNYNLSFENNEIHYYLEDEDLYMNCGIQPISKDAIIHPRDFTHNKGGIKIKAKRMKNTSILHKLMALQNPLYNQQEREKSVVGEKTLIEQKTKSRRTKQRRIGYIINKVIEWRKLCGGINSINQQQKMSLEDAAQKVGISKKSLDDYLFQIRFGNKFGFNFNEHYNDKVGVLRDFVRSKKKPQKNTNEKQMKM